MARKKYPKEPKTAMSIDPYIFHCCKRCARKRQTRYLPPELVFQFLVQLPAQVLHDVMRRVCREWNLIIHSRDFIHHHLRNSTSGILIQDLFPPRNVIYVEMRRGCPEICKLDWGFKNVVWTSCNGLVLVPDSEFSYNLCVINPLTKQRTILPPYFHRIGDHSYFCLAFAEASMEYKAVRVCNENLGPIIRIAVLTIGVDKVWRCIDVQDLLLPTEIPLVSSKLVTRGYVHWFGQTFILTLNADTEAVRRFSIPQEPKIYGKYLAMGSNLSYVAQSDPFIVDVWEMNPEIGEWIMMLRLDLEPVRHIFEDLSCRFVKSMTPFGWLEAREVLVFSTWHRQRRCIAYNVRTREIHQSIELCTNENVHHFQAHVNSLVGLEGGF